MIWRSILSWPVAAMAILAVSACPELNSYGQEVGNTVAEKTETGSTAITDDEPAMLTIGSKAPNLDIEHWVSNGNGAFQKVTSIESGKVYVVEFWATWCGPCIGSMPHLAETQKKYADKGVQIISVSDEEIAIVNGFLEKEFEGPGENAPKTYGELTSVYCLTCDPDGSVEKDYFRAAGQSGIPCCFIVGKTGLVEWIGHPMEMDTPLGEVVGGTWDRETFAVAFRKEQESAIMEMKLTALMQDGDTEGALALIAKARTDAAGDKDRLEMLGDMEFQIKARPAFEKLQAGNMKEGLEMLDALIATATPAQKAQISMIRFSVMMQQRDFPAAAKALTEMANAENADPQMLNQITWTLFEMSQGDSGFDGALMEAATAASEKAAALAPDDGSILDTWAHLLHKQGKLDQAIEVQTKAMANPGPAAAEIKAFLDQLIKEKADK